MQSFNRDLEHHLGFQIMLHEQKLKPFFVTRYEKKLER